MFSLNAIVRFRRLLHQNPEISGLESATAKRVVRFFEGLQPDGILDNLGGNGVAFIFEGQAAGPTLLLRCELDALPIQETNTFDHRSVETGKAHKCGHDGHMAIIAAVGSVLARHRPARGRVVLLYQPAEETGAGAAAVIRDPKFDAIKPDMVFALHNLPGFPLGDIIVRQGTFSCASRGMIIQLHGTTAHAAQPETGKSPAQAMCRLITAFDAVAERFRSGSELAFATVVGARLGEKAFGTSPGYAQVMATLRSETDDTMNRIIAHMERTVSRTTAAFRLSYDIAYEDVFRATVNAGPAVDIIERANAGKSIIVADKPFRWSEDFGRFTAAAPGALFGLGAGENTPDLHNPDYDFPDALIEAGADSFLRIVRQCLGGD